MKPEDGKYTRKGEKDGAKLTPGERALNWAKAAAVIVPLIGIGAVADEPVARWVGLAEVDHKTEIGNETFEEQVKRFSEETRNEIDGLKNQDQTNDYNIRKLLHEIDKRLKKVEELVN